MLTFALALALHAAPTVPPVKLLERFVFTLSSWRCEAASADAGVPVLASVYKQDHSEWAERRIGRCRVTTEVVPLFVGLAAASLRDPEPVPGGRVSDFDFRDAAPTMNSVLRLKVKPLNRHAFNTYTARELEQLWVAIYVAPSTPLLGTTAQEVYDVLFKKAAADTVSDLLWLEASLDDAARAALLVTYRKKLAEAKTKPFFVNLWLSEVLRTRFESDPHVWTASPLLLGVMLRRTADGSWPALRGLLVKTLSAYDPPLAEQLTAPR